MVVFILFCTSSHLFLTINESRVDFSGVLPRSKIVYMMQEFSKLGINLCYESLNDFAVDTLLLEVVSAQTKININTLKNFLRHFIDTRNSSSGVYIATIQAMNDCYDLLKGNTCTKETAVNMATGMTDLVSSDYMHAWCSYGKIARIVKQLLVAAEKYSASVTRLIERERLGIETEMNVNDARLSHIREENSRCVVMYYRAIAGAETAGIELIERIMRHLYPDRDGKTNLIVTDLMECFKVIHTLVERKKTKSENKDGTDETGNFIW
ncbi:hypothetical protein RF11_13161 [Thelohanellus kitauei]|uniref:Uncharacterized protein n=1 Tax=Thelohanellus kitauei TaxID=669202 RepID=A0A0C2IZR8_THEKT|nr:hypothetical protein RF11_13161 [Thelohanellus kitauei]